MQAELDDAHQGDRRRERATSRCSSRELPRSARPSTSRASAPSSRSSRTRGGKELEEPSSCGRRARPIIGEYMAKWVQSYRDLPLLLNQWANVVRWELRPRAVPAHHRVPLAGGAHRARDARRTRARTPTRILHDVYEDFMVHVLAIPVLRRAQDRERALPRRHQHDDVRGDDARRQGAADGHAATSSARTSPASSTSQYLDDAGAQQLCWTTSWGASTRMMGGLIMAHGDDNGLVVPPRLAPIQCVVLLVKDEDGAGDAARDARRRAARRRRARRARRSRRHCRSGGGPRDWELKGVPLRLEVGPRDLAEGDVTIVRRDTRHEGAGQRGRGGGRRSSARSTTRAGRTARRGDALARRAHGRLQDARRDRRGLRRSASPAHRGT